MFPDSYEQSRERFRAHLGAVQARWPDARLESHALHDHADLTIDWIRADVSRPRRLLMLSTGLHGVEGYVGAAIVDLFVAEFLPLLEPHETGLILVHAVNPWGMVHGRRVNPNNVDLNRNFVLRWQGMDQVNPAYDRVRAFLNPSRPLGNWSLANVAFYAAVVGAVLKLGVAGARASFLCGQYRHPHGLYFGGRAAEEETKVVMALQDAALAAYELVVHLDMHSGYGPRDQMSVVNAAAEPASPEEYTQSFHYPRVVSAGSGQFFPIHGDVAESWYEKTKASPPGKRVYAAAFEFGTFGESLPAAIRSLRAMILENRLHWHGARSRAAAEKARREFQELYCPSAPAWRAKAIQDARRAFGGILAFYGLIADGGSA